MNRQEAFTRVKNHLLAQNERSVEAPGAACLYRGPNGTKCAIGALLPDGPFEKAYHLNSTGIRSLCEQSIECAEALGNPDKFDMGFLQELQGIHDCLDTPAWEFALKRFAQRYGLEY